VDYNRLKSLVTNDTISVEKKGLEVAEYKNYSRIFIFSNSYNCLRLAPSDRRFAVFGTSNKYCRNKEYFDKLFSHLTQEVADHFISYLLQYDISKWDHNQIPITLEKEMMTEHKDEVSNEINFLIHHFDQSKYDKKGRVTTEEFYKDYFDFALTNGFKPIDKLKLVHNMKPYVVLCKYDSGTKRGFKKNYIVDNEKVRLISDK
jgi:phage/plasmid-associated DNA primase